MRARDIPEAVEAADPSTSPERLGDIADVYQELHPILVLNPACPDDLRQWIRATTPEANEAWENHLAAERGQGVRDGARGGVERPRAAGWLRLT